jgi:hypothetical protein
MNVISIAYSEPPDLDIDARVACAFRDLVDDARRSTLDFLRTTRQDGTVIGIMDRATRQMAADLKRLSHRPATQFYETEIRRLRAELELKDLVIQQLGQAVAGREMAGAR